MPRQKRDDFPGARHHVMSRGARKEEVFRDTQHCSLFLSILAELPQRFAVLVHGYALMPNHFHLMLESQAGRLSAAMGFLLSRFTVAANKLDAWDGPVFRGRFHNRLVYEEQHWTHLLAYLHLNPVKARLAAKPEQFRWTSHRFYAEIDAPPPWLTTAELNELLEPLGGYRVYLKDVRARRYEAPDGFDAIAFEGRRERLGELPKPKTFAKPPRPSLSAHAALRRVADAAGCTVKQALEPLRGRGGNPARVAAVQALVIDAGLSHKDVAKRLSMTEVDVSRYLTKARQCQPAQVRLAEILSTLEQSRR